MPKILPCSLCASPDHDMCDRTRAEVRALMPKVHKTPKRPNPTRDDHTFTLAGTTIVTRNEAATHAHVQRLFRAWKARRAARGEGDVSFATFETQLIEHDRATRVSAFNGLVDGIAAGHLPPIPEHMRHLVEGASAAGPIGDVEAWSERLAADIADATENG